jgi:hypothetical protein
VASSNKPWAVVVTALVCVLITLGALVTAGVLRHQRVTEAASDETTTPATTTGPGANGCSVEPCKVEIAPPIGGTSVQLVADAGGRSGRLQIGGGGASSVIEVTITKLGATLGAEALRCVGGALSACVVRGASPEGMLAQLVVGRSGKWASTEKAFVSDASFVGLQDVTGRQTGPEVLVAQHRCDRDVAADCGDTPVHVEVFSVKSELLGCTRDYARLESIPGWPEVDLSQATLRPCE